MSVFMNVGVPSGKKCPKCKTHSTLVSPSGMEWCEDSPRCSYNRTIGHKAPKENNKENSVQKVSG